MGLDACLANVNPLLLVPCLFWNDARPARSNAKDYQIKKPSRKHAWCLLTGPRTYVDLTMVLLESDSPTCDCSGNFNLKPLTATCLIQNHRVCKVPNVWRQSSSALSRCHMLVFPKMTIFFICMSCVHHHFVFLHLIFLLLVVVVVAAAAAVAVSVLVAAVSCCHVKVEVEPTSLGLASFQHVPRFSKMQPISSKFQVRSKICFIGF